MTAPKKQTGFTLVELLVAVSVIAILSIIGFTVFRDANTKAKDAKIKADLDAIRKAYETKFDPSLNGGQGGYKELQNRDFASGKIPAKDDGTSYSFEEGPNVSGEGDSTKFKVCAELDGGSRHCVRSTQGVSP